METFFMLMFFSPAAGGGYEVECGSIHTYIYIQCKKDDELL